MEDLQPREEKEERPLTGKYKTTFKKGQPRPEGAGRVTGKSNRMPTLLKECILAAAELHGKDGKGKDGLTGFLFNLAEKDIRAFAMLLGRVLPLQIDHRREVKVDVRYSSVEEVQEELAQRGIRLDLLARALYNKPTKLIDNEGKDVGVGD